MLTIEFQKVDKVSERYYKFNKIPYAVFQNSSIKILLFNFIKFIRKININYFSMKFSIKYIYGNFIILTYFIRVSSYLNFLKNFSSLKLIYFHYDILVRTELVFACHICNIKTISAQERPASYIIIPYLIFDHYLTLGHEIANDMKSKGHMILNFHPIGLPRSYYINSQNIKKHKKSQKIKMY